MGHSNSKPERTAIKIAKYMKSHNCNNYYRACDNKYVNPHRFKDEIAEIFAAGYYGKGVLAQYKKLIRQMDVLPPRFDIAIDKYKKSH